MGAKKVAAYALFSIAWFRLDSEAVSIREAGFHRVVGGWCSRGGWGGLGEMRGGGAPK